MTEELPALAEPADLAPNIGMTAEALEASEVLTARAQEALEEASDNVRDAAGGRTFVVDGEPQVPRSIRRVVLAAARRAFWLYGTDGLAEESLDDWRGKVHESVMDGADLTPAEIKRCARYAGLAQAYSVPLSGTDPSTL